jgi:hypothetical protein
VSVRTLARAALLALALLPAGAFAATADDGRSDAGRTGRPPSPAPLTQLRPAPATPLPTLAPHTAVDIGRAPVRKELVIFVPGYGTNGSDSDRDFAALKRIFPADRYDVIRFGDDRAFPFDAYGSLDVSAATLTAQIRSAGKTYTDIHLVSHSMGGNVVDRAFSSGLSAADGVRTDIAIAAPHNGATYATVPTVLLPLLGPVSDIVRAAAVLVARDPDSPAARDLATFRPVPPPAGIVRLDVSLATDGVVNARDARDPGVTQRLYLPTSPLDVLDGHGGSLRSLEIRNLVYDTIRLRRIPEDDRGMLAILLAPPLWDAAERAWITLLALAAVAAVAIAAARLLPACRYVIDRVALSCREFLRRRGR